jgi:hypothetical protein
MKFAICAVGMTALLCLATVSGAQLAESFTPARLHPAINYAQPTTDDAVARLNARLRDGAVRLTFEPVTGYLRSVLDAFGIAAESQVLVFSKTSFQAPKINPRNPRALFFADEVAIGWVRGGDVLEVIAQDPRQGAIFYTLKQSTDAPPQFERNDTCVSCHLSTATFDVPGMFAASMYVNATGQPLYAPVYQTDHRSRFEQRWGGWFVTGRHGRAQHMGNGTVKDETELAALVQPSHQNLTSLDGRTDLDGYPVRTSDIVALMVLEHQMHMSNLLTRIAWESRLNTPEARAMKIADTPAPVGNVIEATRVGAKGAANLKLRPLRAAAIETVDYMLFVDEAPLEGAIEGVSGFAARFSTRGPRDSRGRSLRDLDLATRLMRYPLTYMIYSAQFDALPGEVKDALYERLWEVLSGAANDAIYAKMLPVATRQAIVEILRETKPGLPAYFQPVVR